MLVENCCCGSTTHPTPVLLASLPTPLSRIEKNSAVQANVSGLAPTGMVESAPASKMADETDHPFPRLAAEGPESANALTDGRVSPN